MVEVWRYCHTGNIPALTTGKQAFRRLRLKCELHSCQGTMRLLVLTAQKRKRPQKRSLVEAVGLEPAVSSTRTKKNAFFDYQTLHIARIFRKIVSFCTLFPLFPYRTFPVVVSYVVKPKMMIKIGAAGAFGKPTLLLIN